MKKFIILISCFAISSFCFAQSSDSIFDQDRETVINYFKSETIGGRLDFEMKMKDDERGLYAYDNIIYNRKDFGIFLWGQAIKRTNQFSKKEAARFWEEIQGRKLSKPEKKALYRGFETNIE